MLKIFNRIGIRFQKPTFTPLRILVALGILGVGLAQLLNFEIPKQAVIAVMLMGIVLSTYDMRYDLQRKRPRARMKDLMLMGVALCGVFALMLVALLADGEEDARKAACYFGVAILLSAIVALWGFVRWRRLRAQAELRLWQLRTARRKRAKNY